jgi:hypothetical protein
MPFPPSGTSQDNSPQEEQFHYEGSRGDIARGFSPGQDERTPSVVLVMSQAAENTRDFCALSTVFTTTLQHFYGTFMTAWGVHGILYIVCQELARGRSW